MNIYVALQGKLRWSTWIGGEPEIWQILVYYVFFDYSPVYGTVYKRTDEAGTGSGYEIRVIQPG